MLPPRTAAHDWSKVKQEGCGYSSCDVAGPDVAVLLGATIFDSSWGGVAVAVERKQIMGRIATSVCSPSP